MKETKNQSINYYAIINGVHSYIGTKPDNKADRSVLCATFGHAKRMVVETLMWESEVLEGIIEEVVRMNQSDLTSKVNNGK